jgi:hypothetical protein
MSAPVETIREILNDSNRTPAERAHSAAGREVATKLGIDHELVIGGGIQETFARAIIEVGPSGDSASPKLVWQTVAWAETSDGKKYATVNLEGSLWGSHMSSLVLLQLEA